MDYFKSTCGVPQKSRSQIISENIFQGMHLERIAEYFTFADLCLKVNCREKLSDAINYVQQFFDFGNAVCGLVGFADNSYSNLLEMINVSFPHDWIKLYIDKNYHTIDPVIARHFERFKPQVWSQTYQQTSNVDSKFISTAMDFGLVDGVCHGIRDDLNAQGSFFSFSDTPAMEKQSAIQQLELIIPLLHIALCNCHKQKKKEELMAKRKACIPLSEREKEVLNWIKIGKTNWEISMILGISERTVKFHVINIFKKLNTSSRSYAVAKALDLSIIHL